MMVQTTKITSKLLWIISVFSFQFSFKHLEEEDAGQFASCMDIEMYTVVVYYGTYALSD